MSESGVIRAAGEWVVAGPAAVEARRQPGMRQRALFLDRDGVINVDHGYVHTAEMTEWVPGIFELCKVALDVGLALVVVTNQAGIGRGYYDDGQFRDYARWVHAQFMQRGLPILATYYCPEHPEAVIPAYRNDSGYRKPQPGMLLDAARDWNLDLGASLLVGDQPSDIEAARRAHVGRAFLMGEDRWEDVAAWMRTMSSRGRDHAPL
ncbi:MAG: HAD family hydrolase [Stenotrophomonas nitritireducens]|uniref:HAD family hydrolase n=1 Tax=Stenotrophomonas nitritireducens TaxID=83617 RepID=UPI001ACE3E3C|nr:HAD family hydrolase [Stenotrophomonas nitritireducens]MBN8793568.1 HAD family hydrolase [Stenotrophomonas nitritireducens]MBN8797139.1 HAD family hydrolase [Stenotrophomonas nitritireducens]